MLFCVFLAILGAAVGTEHDGSLTAPSGVAFVGIGYNVVEGNPEGDDTSHGGIDHGLLVSRKIFSLTYKTNKLTGGSRYKVPDQIAYSSRHSCVEDKETKASIVFGSKSYQSKLKADVEASAGFDHLGLMDFAFSLSALYESMKLETSTNHNVFYEEKKVCNKGRARYLLDVASSKNFAVTDDFAAAVCNLPEQFDKNVYLNFIDKWGTAQGSVSEASEFLGFSSSLKVDMGRISESIDEVGRFGEVFQKLTSGSDEMNEPIALTLLPIHVAFDAHFYKALTLRFSCNHTEEFLETRKKHINKILCKYPRLKKAFRAIDPEVRIPLVWPRGTYGLPMPKDGCPKASDFVWRTGTRYHDMENIDPKASWSAEWDMAGHYSKSAMEQKFCIKTTRTATTYDLPWPKGRYCIFKKGDCPEDFNKENVVWKDELKDNRNSYSGELPDGDYDPPNGLSTTKIYYCCRSDGVAASDPIYLPTDLPFALFKSGSHLCQEVEGMQVKSEYFYWDCDNEAQWNEVGFSDTQSPRGGTGPGPTPDIRIDYCYYQPPPVPGGWSEWSSWGPCHHRFLCAPGQTIETRLRTCTSPPPKYGGSCPQVPNEEIYEERSCVFTGTCTGPLPLPPIG